MSEQGGGGMLARKRSGAMATVYRNQWEGRLSWTGGGQVGWERLERKVARVFSFARKLPTGQPDRDGDCNGDCNWDGAMKFQRPVARDNDSSKRGTP